MASLRKLRGRMLTWERYAARVVFNPRINQPWASQPPRGYQRAARAVTVERERREVRAVYWPLGHAVDDVLDWPPPTDDERRRREHLDACWDGCDDLHDGEFFCGDPDCSCGEEPDDDAGHGDDWPPFVVTTTAFQEAGLL